MAPRFVHLKLHTEYSMVDGIVRVKPMIAECKEQNMVAVAMTDQMNMCGLVKFYSGAINAGVKPIVGADLLIQNQKIMMITFGLLPCAWMSKVI